MAKRGRANDKNKRNQPNADAEFAQEMDPNKKNKKQK